MDELLTVAIQNMGSPQISDALCRIEGSRDLQLLFDKRAVVARSDGDWFAANVGCNFKLEYPSSPRKLINRLHKILLWATILTVAEIQRAMRGRSALEWHLVIRKGRWMSVRVDGQTIFVESSFRFERS